MIIFGAAILGEVTLHACRAKGIAVDCVIDNRITGHLLDVPILALSDFKEHFFSAEGIYLTSPNIQDMIDPLAELGFENWKSCGEVLHDFDISGIDFQSINGSNQASRYSTEHVKYLIRTCLHHHDNYMHPERLTAQSVDLIITERCSMKCQDCANLMAYYAGPENADLDEMLATIDSMCAKFDEIGEVRVIGGEPFMNKEVHLIVEKLTSQDKIRQVGIFTNATIVPRDAQWSAFKHSKVRFFITDYDELSRNIQKLIPALEERGIHYVSEKANGWTDCAALDKHNRSVKENEKLFSECCAKNLATAHNGLLFRCPFSANAYSLQAVPYFAGDQIVVADASRGEIKSFLRDKTMIDACDFCNGRSYGAPVIKPAIQTASPLKYVKYERKLGA